MPPLPHNGRITTYRHALITETTGQVPARRRMRAWPQIRAGIMIFVQILDVPHIRV